MKRILSILMFLFFLAGLLIGSCTDTSGDDDGGGDSDSDGDGDKDDDDDDDDDDVNACRKIDVVIAVDASDSMTEELEAMREDVFPAFADKLSEISEDDDSFRVATLDSCPNPANFHTQNSDEDDCDFNGGNVWIKGSSSDLDDEFKCVGDILTKDADCPDEGNNSADEQPVSTVIQALNDPWIDDENDGFLREDGLLVVIAITDEDEQPTGGMPNDAQTLHDMLVDIKGGNEQSVVFLGIGGENSCNGSYGRVDNPARLLRDITRAFERDDRGIWWDLCDGRLEDGLEEAISIIESACESIGPV